MVHKAGMDDCNMDELARKVHELSKDSDHYKKQEFKTERAKQKGLAKLKQIESHQSNQRLYRQKRNDALAFIGDLERERDLTRTWFHIDMDMFYAAVEIRDRPELATLPIAVGSMQMITTANYIARKFGVRSAMPGYLGV